MRTSKLTHFLFHLILLLALIASVPATTTPTTISFKATELLALQSTLKSRITAHHSLVTSQLALINSTLTTLNGGVDNTLTKLRKGLFVKTSDLPKIVNSLKNGAINSENTGVDHTVKIVMKCVKVIEKEMGEFESFMVETEGKADELIKEITGESGDGDGSTELKERGEGKGFVGVETGVVGGKVVDAPVVAPFVAPFKGLIGHEIHVSTGTGIGGKVSRGKRGSAN